MEQNGLQMRYDHLYWRQADFELPDWPMLDLPYWIRLGFGFEDL